MQRGGAQFLRWAAALVVLAFVGDRILAAGCRHLLLDSQQRFSVMYRGGVPPGSVLVVGDSRGVNSVYAPAASAVAGRLVFNLSYNGMSTEVAEAVVSDCLDLNPRPALVVIEVTSLAQTPDLINEMKSYAGASPRLSRLLARVAPEAAAAMHVTHLFRYDTEMFLRSLYYLDRSDQDWINRYTISAGTRALARTEPEWSLRATPTNLRSLGRMTAQLRARGIPYRLFVGPYLPAHAKHWANADSFVRTVEGVVDHRDTVWNYSGAVPETSASGVSFSDRLHLNITGGLELLRQLQHDCFFDPGATRPCDAPVHANTNGA